MCWKHFKVIYQTLGVQVKHQASRRSKSEMTQSKVIVMRKRFLFRSMFDLEAIDVLQSEAAVRTGFGSSCQHCGITERKSLTCVLLLDAAEPSGSFCIDRVC